MKKYIKRITVFITVVMSFGVMTNINLLDFNNAVYAVSSDVISQLRLKSGESGVGLYSSRNYKRENKIYQYDKLPEFIYCHLSSNQKTIKIDTIETGAADIRVFVGEGKEKLNSINDAINIKSDSKEKIFIRIYDSKAASDDDDIKEYEIVVDRDEGEDYDTYVEEEENQLDSAKGDVYLDRISLLNDGKKIDFLFDENQTIYNINVDESIGYLTIKAVPKTDGDRVKVNGDTLDKKGDDKYKKDVNLEKGKNVVKVSVIGDNYVKREYFLNIVRGKAVNNVTTNKNDNNNVSKSDTVNNSSQNTVIKYNESNNKAINVQQAAWLYRNSDGTLAKGWKNINNEWYYFDENGAMKTGWIQLENKWYYLNTNTGSMAKNTVVDGYRLKNDGAWVK